MKVLTKMIWLLLALEALVEHAAAQEMPTSPYNTGAFAEANVKAYSEYVIGLFFEDCEKWADSFAWNQSATLCDGYVKDCIHNYEDAVDSCRRDSQGGGPHVTHVNNTVFPRWFVEDSIPYPKYTEIAITGKSTLCQVFEQDFGFGRFTPLCYDFVQLNTFIENPSKKPFGLEVLVWDGYYTISIGTCPGYPTVDCESPAMDDSSSPTEESGGPAADAASSSGAYDMTFIYVRWQLVAWMAWATARRLF